MSEITTVIRTHWLRFLFCSLLLVGCIGGKVWLLYQEWMRPKNAVKWAIEQTLVAPATAQYEKLEILEHEKQGANDYYFAHVIVDAQNKYGALLRQKYCVIVMLTPDDYVTSKSSGVQECEEPPKPEDRKWQKERTGWK